MANLLILTTRGCMNPILRIRRSTSSRVVRSMSSLFPEKIGENGQNRDVTNAERLLPIQLPDLTDQEKSYIDSQLEYIRTVNQVGALNKVFLFVKLKVLPNYLESVLFKYVTKCQCDYEVLHLELALYGTLLKVELFRLQCISNNTVQIVIQYKYVRL